MLVTVQNVLKLVLIKFILIVLHVKNVMVIVKHAQQEIMMQNVRHVKINPIIFMLELVVMDLALNVIPNVLNVQQLLVLLTVQNV